MLGVGSIWVGGAVAEAPMGIIGDVTVQNDATHPVPVTIQGQNGNEQEPVPVRDVDHPARAHFQRFCTLGIQNGEDSGSCQFSQVPLGNRLVVEFISGRIAGPTNQSYLIDVSEIRPTGFAQRHYLTHNLQRQNVDGRDWYVVSQLVRVYLDEEESLSIRVSRDPDITSEVTGTFFLTGYLISVEE